ncbi:MAG: helix-turn-helix domain-containing protein [Clostridia bacterium]|nr:helix-turn-helix domain-containing protein [Clostridia bacterium]
MSFAENFKRARLAADLTQQQIADALGLDRSAIAHYEMGDSMSNARNLQKICELMGITLNDLLIK